MRIDIGPGDATARGLLRARLAGIHVYGDAARDQAGAWCLSWRGGAGQLTEEARARCPGDPPAGTHATWLASVSVDAFLPSA
ncbi:hypothetical protein H0Z60_11790 [Ectothiorhodospiraceae bacterium WFHF3C12]|nr:hypothetical protein [Ectothiorhodospiraceae bacterium WFHF3C12]